MSRTEERVNILVISLPGSSRRAAIARRLESLRLPFVFSDGIFIKPEASLSEYGYSRIRSLLAKGRELSRGEVGCYLAHCRAMQSVIANGWSSAVVLEDDAVLGTHFTEVVERSLPLLGRFDVIKLHCHSSSRGFQASDIGIGPHCLGSFSGGSFGAVGYLISNHGAATFLKNMSRPCVPLDDALDTWKNGLKLAAWFPSVVTQGEHVSSDIWSDSTLSSLRKASGIQRIFYRIGKQYRKARRISASRKMPEIVVDL